MENWIEKNVLTSWRPYAWIAGLGFLIYFQTLFFNFTYLDDNVLILDNIGFLKDLSNFFTAFTTEVFHVMHHSAAYYRPMLTLSFMLDAQAGGTSPFVYHLDNLLIHLIASCLLFVFFIKLGYARLTSFAFSLVFAVHPVLSQAVAWIPGRNDSLMAVFILAAFIAFLDFIETKKWKYYLWHLFFFALAVFTKESALVLVALVFFYLHFIAKERLLSFNKKILSAGWLLIIVIWFFIRRIALVNPIEMTVSDMVKSVFNNLPALIQFIGKIIFPFNLSVLPLIQDTTFLWGLTALVLVILLLISTKDRNYRIIIFGALWFLLFLLPSFIRPNPTVVADFIEHRIYLPIIGFFLILAETGAVQRFFRSKKAPIVFVIIVIVVFSSINFVHSKNFKERTVFWKNAAENSPHSPLAHRNLGAMYYLDGELDKAEGEYKKSLELNPFEEMAHNNLGLVYADKGDLNKAEEEYQKEIEINPIYDDVHFNLGLLYYKKGEKEKAAESWKRAVEINPDFLDAYKNLTFYYWEAKDLEQARFYARILLKKGVRLDSEFLKSIGIYLF